MPGYDANTYTGHIAMQKNLDSAALVFHTKTHGTKQLTGERMRIHGNGRVGIGTAAPAELLQVEGKVRAKDGFCIGTSCIGHWKEHGSIDMEEASADVVLRLRPGSGGTKDSVIKLQGPAYSHYEGMEICSSHVCRI